MAHVHIPALLRTATEGREWVEVQGSNVREVVAALESAYPALHSRLMKNGRLLPGLAVAIDGEITSLGLLEAVGDETEVQFLTAIQGG
jgi:molybdopterin converting factor small subunit